MALQHEAEAGAMVVASPRSKAERAMIDGFAGAIDRLPGSGWVDRVRHEALRTFEARGLPTRRIEAYKYTDLRERLNQAYPPATGGEPALVVDAAALDAALGPLAQIDAYRLVFVDGCYRPDCSRAQGLEAVAEVMALGPLLNKAPDWLEGKFSIGRLALDDAVSALNAAFMSDGLLLKIKPGQRPDRPVMIVSVRGSAEPRIVTTRNVIAVEAGAKLTLIEAAVALDGAAPATITNRLSDVTVGDGAELDHIGCVCDDSQAQFLSNWAADVGCDARYGVFQMTLAAGLVRNGLAVNLAGRGSKLDISGAFLGRGTAHTDTTLVVDHRQPGCESRELFKGVLDDRARGVFQGKVIVRPGAVKSDGQQMARALMLSPDAEFDSKPELEIYADDVACGHGSTATEIDRELLFYCRARGIPLAQARALLIESFIGEAIDKVRYETIRSALMELGRIWLTGLTSAHERQ